VIFYEIIESEIKTKRVAQGNPLIIAI
jgi:hypothetical protein